MTLAKKERKDPREAAWLAAYFSPFANEGRGDAEKAAIKAGYSPNKAESVGRRLERDLNKRPLLESLKHAGVTRVKLAMMLQNMMQFANTTTNAAEMRQITRLLLEVLGEIGDTAQPTINVNAGQGAQILVVTGKTDERMKRLKAGAGALPPTPQEATNAK